MAQDVTLTMDGLLLNWLKEVGDSVSAGEVIAEFEADKATVEVEAPSAGVLTETLVDIGEEVPEGTVVARIGEAGEAGASQESAQEAPAKAEAEPQAEESQAQPTQTQQPSSNGAARTEDGRIKASPLARNIAEERGIDLAQVSGTGPGGRITKSDVEGFDPSKVQKQPPRVPDSVRAEPGKVEGAAPAYQSYGKLPDESDDVVIEDMSRMRKAIAKGTITTWNTTPHFYVTVEMNMEPLLALRKELNAQLESEGVKITVNDMLVKAAALTQRQFMNLNSHYYGDKVVRHQRVNIAIAVALPDNGLVNVVSPDADRTTLSELARYHKMIFDEVRNGKIKPEYIQDGTFLVSNLGAYGVEQFSAIIDPPQSGALAVGSSRTVPIVKEDGTLGIGTRMKVTLSIDHRISDGAEGAQWCNHFRDLVENPMRLLV
jgi:pyruvate dehydrogenase E2 component (dihydrolipoamide acetyltransferase)